MESKENDIAAPTIKEISDRIYKNPEHKNNRLFVSLYEANKAVIENTGITTNKEAAHIVIQLMSDYALSLSGSGNYTKAIEYFDKAIPLLENDLKLNNNIPFKTQLYEALIWGRATTLHYLKRYNEAAKDLKNLVANFPDNDMYRAWLRSIAIHKIDKVKYIFITVGFIGLPLSFVPSKRDPLRLDILIFSMVFFFIGGMLEFIQYILRNKK